MTNLTTMTTKQIELVTEFLQDYMDGADLNDCNKWDSVEIGECDTLRSGIANIIGSDIITSEIDTLVHDATNVKFNELVATGWTQTSSPKGWFVEKI